MRAECQFDYTKNSDRDNNYPNVWIRQINNQNHKISKPKKKREDWLFF